MKRPRARETFIGTRGVEGTIGETVMERNDETVPRALIMTKKTAPLAYLTLMIDASNPQREYPY